MWRIALLLAACGGDPATCAQAAAHAAELANATRDELGMMLDVAIRCKGAK